MFDDKKIILDAAAHIEGSPAVRETESVEKRVVVVPSGPGHGNNRPKNILADLSKEDLLADVRMFATQKGLEEYLPDLEKGALLAQRPEEYDDIDELTDEDRAVIKYEKEHKWSHPLWLWLTIIICSTGEFLVIVSVILDDVFVKDRCAAKLECGNGCCAEAREI